MAEKSDEIADLAAHDLREPLRVIRLRARQLSKTSSERLDAEGRAALEDILRTSDHMSCVIDDLLSLSRAGQKPQRMEEVDTREVFEQVLTNLGAAIRESGARVVGGRLPLVRAQPFRLVQLLQNLVQNAISFCEAARPQIEVGAERRGADWLFSVNDNGVGIEPRYHAEIFEPLRRVHGPREVVGTGVGLAISRRIVESYGGRIWVSSAPGRGSTFYFTLPAPEAAPRAPIVRAEA